MRELHFDHVTLFPPITRLNFWILKLLRGYPYNKINNGVFHIWVGFVKSGILPIYDKPWWQILFATYFMTGPEYIGAHIRQNPPIYDKPPHIWQIPPGCDGSNWTVFVTGFCRIWAPIYSGPVMKYVANKYYMGFVTKVCHIWGVFQIWQIPPIYDKPLYSSVGREKTSSLLDQWESSILIMWPLFDQSQGSVS